MRLACVILFGAIVGCRGPILDLGPSGDPSCSEVAPGVDLAHVDFGRGPGADCARFYALSAAAADDEMTRIDKDVGFVCSLLAPPTSIDPDTHESCSAAIAAVEALPPIDLVTKDPETCALGPLVPCGACGTCDEHASAVARSACRPPTVTADGGADASALSNLDATLPLLVEYTGGRWDGFQATLDALHDAARTTLDTTPLDPRQQNCMKRSVDLLADAAAHLRTARSEASAVVRAIPR